MTNRNSSASVFGWHFQVNAGIVIMLDYIREAKAVKIEGQTEDIEVLLQDGSVVFAQAKSCMDPEDSSNAVRDLRKALETLSEAESTGKAKAVLLVTNRADPFHEESCRRYFANRYSPVPYDALPQVCKQRIQGICMQDGRTLRTEHFSVLSLQFSGDAPYRYATIQEHVSEFLVGINSHFQGFGRKLLPKWQLQFGQNASQTDRSKTITKKEMMWPLIVIFCENVDDPILDNCDDADRELIEELYADVISDQSERFDLVTKIASSYDRFKAEHFDMSDKALVQKLFIEEKEEAFADEFDFDGKDPEIARTVRKLTILKVLQQRRKIAEVKEAVNL